MQKLIYPACFYPFEDGNGYTVVVPDLPGCVTEGNSLVEAIAMATDAASGWLLDELEDGNELPHSTAINSLELDEPDGFFNLLVIDIDEYASKYGTKSIRKNITIPAYMETYLKKNNISLSEIVQNSIVSHMENK